MLPFEIRLEEFPANLKPNLKPLNRGIPHDRVLWEGDSLIQTRDGACENRLAAIEILSQPDALLRDFALLPENLN